MTACIRSRGPAPARHTRIISDKFLLREDAALVREVIAHKHRAAGETLNPRTGCWEAARR